jgi:hypothetical protein
MLRAAIDRICPSATKPTRPSSPPPKTPRSQHQPSTPTSPPQNAKMLWFARTPTNSATATPSRDALSKVTSKICIREYHVLSSRCPRGQGHGTKTADRRHTCMYIPKHDDQIMSTPWRQVSLQEDLVSSTGVSITMNRSTIHM